MKILEDNRIEEIKRLEHLLYGFNYQVTFFLYGPAESEIGLQEALYKLVSKEAEISGIIPSTAKMAKTEIMSMVLYKGDPGSGPIDLEAKQSEIKELMDIIFLRVDLDNADIVSEFGFKQGHPAYPVFWDFAFDIHSNGKRWIFVGSSSD